MLPPGAQVISIERRPALAARRAQALDALGVANVEVVVGDGSRGMPERAPFEAIAVHATAPAPPLALLAQLADGGRLVVPIAGGGADLLTVFRRRGDASAQEIGPCRFVPLIGEEGFAGLSPAQQPTGCGVDAVLDDFVAASAAAVDRLVALAVDASMKSLPPLPMKVSAPRCPRKLFSPLSPISTSGPSEPSRLSLSSRPDRACRSRRARR